MNKNIFKSVISGVLVVSFMSILLGSCSKGTTPTLNAPVPTASFTYNMLTPTSVSTAQNLELINTSQNGMVANWSVTNSLGGIIGTYKGDTIRLVLAHAGIYTVTMASSGPGGLSDSISQQVTLAQDNPYAVLANFTYKILTPTDVVNNQNLELINTSKNGDSSISWSIVGVGSFTGDTVKVGIPFAGTYTVNLTAKGYGGMTDVATQTITIANDNPYAEDISITGVLTGSAIQKTKRSWFPIRVIAGVLLWDNYNDVLAGIDAGGGSAWYYFGQYGETATNGTGRDAYFDDTSTFDQSGNFIYNDNNTIYVDGTGSGWTKALNPQLAAGNYNSTAAGPYKVNSTGEFSTPIISTTYPQVAPWGSGNFSYTIAPAPAGAMNLGTVTVTGVGAHIGLCDKSNTIEQVTPTLPSVTYDILRISTNLTDAGGTYDEIIFGVAVNNIGNWWGFRYKSYR
jgi:hypothetical protein